MEEQGYKGGRIALAMAVLYALNGGTQFLASGFLSIYVGQHAFVSSMLVGMIVAMSALVTTVAQPLWGVIADHARTKNKIVAIAVTCVAASVWLFILPRHQSLATLLLSVAAIYFVVYVPQVLVDTIVVENLDKVRLRFGVIRGFASGGAAFIALTLFLLNFVIVMDARTAFVILSCISLLSLIPLRFIPITRGHAHRGGGGAGGKTVGRGGGVNLTMIVKNRRLMLLLGFGLFHFMFVSCQNTYFSVYYATERGMNAGIGMYGLFFALSISGEALVMILGHKLFSRLNVYTVFSVIPLAGSLRALIVYLAPNPYIMMVSAVFHGLMFGLLWMHAAPYIGRIVPNEMRATGQASWSVMVSGLGPVIGSTLGGLLTNFIDIRGVFLFVSCALSLVFIVFSFLFRRQRAIDRAEGFIAQ